MTRKTTIFGGLLLAMAGPLVLAQEMQQPSQPSPEDLTAASFDLVVWSSTQKPKPVPEPLPPPDKGVPEPDQQTSQPPAPQVPQDISTQAFTGKIVRESGVYVLKVSSNTTYQLDEQSSVKEYEDKDVKIIGTLDPGGNTIHVTKIQLLS